MRIVGIRDGDLSITLRQGQNIWPEWTGSDTAEDIQGERYVFVDGAWHDASEFIATPADAEIVSSVTDARQARGLSQKEPAEISGIY